MGVAVLKEQPERSSPPASAKITMNPLVIKATFILFEVKAHHHFARAKLYDRSFDQKGLLGEPLNLPLLVQSQLFESKIPVGGALRVEDFADCEALKPPLNIRSSGMEELQIDKLIGNLS